MLTCKQVSESASDYLEGPTTFWQRLQFRIHLIICKHCRRYLAQLQLTIGTARQMPAPETPSDDDIEALVARLSSEVKPD